MTLRSSSMGKAHVIALFAFGANLACAAAAEPFPTATPESQGLSSQSLGKLLDVVRGFADKGEIAGGEQVEKFETRLKLEKDPFILK